MTRIIPLNKDYRGYTDTFFCTNCKSYVYFNLLAKEVDYNFCPYCGEEVEEAENER